MRELHEKTEVAMDVWQRVGSFDAIRDWHPMLDSVESEGDHVGSRRTAYAKDGPRQVERLQRFDDGSRFYEYKMEATAMPVSNYSGKFRIGNNGIGSSTVEWSATFETDDESAVEMVRGFLRAGLVALREDYPI